MEIEFDCPQVKNMKVEMTRLSRNIDDRDSQIRCLKAKLKKKDGQEAEDLTQISLMASDAVRTIGIYPYDAESDCSEFDEFPGFYPSDDAEENRRGSFLDDEDFLFDEND
ncbi:hypothetical protein TRIUR3_23451 [Triticum urartu]|uniref:Uncharacterized protein n=1 Tax=Triticum urartu TaxID=4572 RepID=M7ZFR4_TRIUA|nr:hypothetical protein TRIUR3_23451 [Triticum urartu]